MKPKCEQQSESERDNQSGGTITAILLISYYCWLSSIACIKSCYNNNNNVSLVELEFIISANMLDDEKKKKKRRS